MCNLGGDLCPVKIYKEFHKRRPKEACLPNSRVYLQPVRKPSLDNDDVWFVNVPLGKNTIGSIAKKMFADAGLASTRKTNHSGRKTAIQTLLHAEVAPTEVQQLSGHKNVQSLNAYSTLSTGQQQQLSNILSKSINPKDLDTASVPRLASVQTKMSQMILLEKLPRLNLHYSILKMKSMVMSINWQMFPQALLFLFMDST